MSALAVNARLAALVLTVASAASCGTDSAAQCSDIVLDVDPTTFHVLGDAEVAYDQSPPSSGPHALPAPEPGVFSRPIAETNQVAALEAGSVIVQYDRSVSADEVAELEALAGNGVVVAPASRPMDDDAAVALTAWGARQLCDGVDLGTARAFARTYVGRFEAQHG